MSSQPSIKDVAKRSGASIATVSNVLNNHRFVSEELREKVMLAVHELGYAVNPIARSLKNKRVESVGVIVSDINCVFFAPLLKGIQNVLNKAGYHMMIYDSDYEVEREIRYIQSMGASYIGGLILAGISDSEPHDFFEKRIADDKTPPMPIVAIERDLTQYKIDSIMVDNLESAYNATSHLIELGCKNIITITAPEKLSIGRERVAGYAKALSEAGMALRDELVREGDFSPISGFTAMREFIQAGITFDGVFAANDQMAVGAIRAIKNAGLRIPEDVKVVGYDNTFIASIVDPSLTTISVPNYEMGVQAAKRILNRIENPNADVQLVTMDYELIIRRSTIISARTNWDMTHW